MFYFGISNEDPLNDPFIKDFNLFPFIRKENLANSIKIEEDEMVMDNTDYHFCSVPVLFEHRNNIALKNIWDGIKDGDIITNRGLKRALAADKKNQKIKRKVVNSAGKEKLIYLITRGEKKKLPPGKFNSGFQAETQVFEYPLKCYTTYKYMKCFNKDLKCFEHYTCGFIKDERSAYVPVEFKCFRSLKISDFVVDRKLKIDAAIQCRLAGIENIIVGARNGDEMKLYHYKLDNFEDDVQNNVKCSFLRMNRNMKELIRKGPEFLKQSWGHKRNS